MNTSRRLQTLASEHGQTMTEYSLLIVLIALVVLAGIPPITSALEGFFSSFASAI
jgi:Flp pilus assembly pilin Flp